MPQLGHFFMRDIEHRSDLEVLLRAFYEKLLDDPEVGYIFTTIAKIDLEPHLVHIVDFWEQTLFNKGSYRNNVLQIHQDLNSLEKLTSRHFEVWLSHFTAIIDNMFT